MTADEDAGGDASQQAADGAAARPRELIARCAAKTAGLTGASAQRYARTVRNQLVLRPVPEASGTALAPAWGIRLEFLRQLGPWLLFVAMCAALALSAPDLWIEALFSAVIGLAFGLSLRLAQLLSWREKVNAAWSAMLPGASVPIRAAANGLTVGETSLSWNDVRL